MKDGQGKIIDVTCALIVDSRNYLFTARRSASMSLPLKWEFPGGKVEPDESAEQSLIREIKEELNIDIEIIKSLPSNKHTYPFVTINLIPFICKQVGGQIILKEHADFKWLNSNELFDLDWADADVPILNHYLNYLNAV